MRRYKLTLEVSAESWTDLQDTISSITFHNHQEFQDSFEEALIAQKPLVAARKGPVAGYFPVIALEQIQ